MLKYLAAATVEERAMSQESDFNPGFVDNLASLDDEELERYIAELELQAHIVEGYWGRALSELKIRHKREKGKYGVQIAMVSPSKSRNNH